MRELEADICAAAQGSGWPRISVASFWSSRFHRLNETRHMAHQCFLLEALLGQGNNDKPGEHRLLSLN